MAYYSDSANATAPSSYGTADDSTSSSKQVFALRKEGKLKEAWDMACQLVSQPQIEDWDLRAFGYCLIDLHKQESVAAQCGLTPYDLARMAQELMARMPQLFASDAQGQSNNTEPDGPDAYFVKRISSLARSDPNAPEAPTSQQVFALRKAGKLQEAWAMAWQLMQQPQINDWDYRAFGYCLIDLNKQANVAAQLGFTLYDLASMARELRERMPQLFADSDTIPAHTSTTSQEQPDPDVAFVRSINRIVNAARANSAALTAAAQADKDKDYAAAVQHYLTAQSLDVLTAQEELSFAWALYHHTKQLLTQEKRNFVPITNNLCYYLSLQHIAKPSVVNSYMLVLADQITDERFHYAEFLQAFNPQTLAPEDLQPSRGKTPDQNGRIPIYEALWQRVLRHMSKNTLQRLDTRERPNEATLEFVVQLCHKANLATMRQIEAGSINLNAPEHKNKIWLLLYEAKLHQHLGDNEHGRDLALTLLRRKSSEYWAWQLMGRLELDHDKDTALTCLCKAQTLNPPFSPKHHVELATLLKDMGQEQWAASELYFLEQVCTSTGLDLPAEGKQQLQQAWVASYKGQQLSDSELQQRYQQHAAAANDLLYAQLPWQAAIVGDTFTVQHGETTKKRTNYYLTTGAFPSFAVLSCKAPAAKFKGMAPGTSIEVKITPEKPDLKSQVTLLEVRASKEERWAHLPLQTAVCTYVNHERKLYKCLLPHDRVVNLNFATAPYKLEAGDEIALGIGISAPKEGTLQPRLTVIYAAKPTEPASSSIKKTVTTTVWTVLPGGIAFTEDDIFIPAALSNAQNLKEEQELEVVAVRSYNKKKNKWGWSALKVTPL